MNKIRFLVLLGFFTFTQIVSACVDCHDIPLRFGISASLGFTQYSSAYKQDGNSTLGRLSLDTRYILSDFSSLALEVGIQNGNTMRLPISQVELDELGGEPVTVSIKPSVDALLAAYISPWDDSGFFAVVKGGIAYRQLQVDRNEVRDFAKTSPELQAGLGYFFNDNLGLHLLYEHIFGGNPNYQINRILQTAAINNIPSQNSLYLGITLLI